MPLRDSGLLARLPERFLPVTEVGLPALDLCGVSPWDATDGGLSFNFFDFPDSLTSPPDPAAPSTSLADPAPGKVLLTRFLLALEQLVIEPVRGAKKIRTGTDDVTGVMGREPGCVEDCEVEGLLFPFLRDVSVPLASDTLGDPRRFRDTPIAAFFDVSECFGRPEGVVLPFDGVAGSFLFFSSSTFRSSSLFFSASVSSELYIFEVR